MRDLSEIVQARLAELAEEAADAVFAVSKHDRALVAETFVCDFTRGLEKRETLEQMENMEGEGCPHGDPE